MQTLTDPRPGVLAITVSDPTRTNPDSGGPQGTLVLYGYSPERTSPPTTAVRFEVKRKSDREWRAVGTDSQGSETETDQIQWSVSVNTATLPDTITANSLAARNASRDNNQYMVRAVAIAEADGSETVSADDVTAMFSVDNVDDVGPLGPTNIVSISKTDGPVSAVNGVYKVGRLVDKYDTTLTPLSLTFTIRPGSSVDRRTYVGGSVRLFQNGVDTGIASVSSASGSWNVTLPDVGKLANGTYSFHAISVDAFRNRQTDGNSPRVTVQIENTRRPAPGVLAITVDDPTQTNPDSGAPQGTLTVNGYTPERTSAPTKSVRLEVKRRESDEEWMEVGTIDTSVAAVEADLADIREGLADAASKDVADPRLVEPYEAYRKWSVSVDTTTLEDTITKDSPGERDVSKDANPYMVRAISLTPDDVDTPEHESPEGVMASFSVDNVDDVGPRGPTNITNVSVKGVDSVFETAEDGSYIVGGLVDKYDDEVASPVATLTIKPMADRHTYKSIRLVTDAEGVLVGDATETAEGSGIFEVTVDVGTLADGETYLENGTYMFHALAFDEFDNEQADESETDGSKISVTVKNSYRPAPEIFAITTDPAAQTNPDSGAPQGILMLNSYTLGERTSPPITSMRFEAKRQDADDSAWKEVGTTAEGTAVSEEEYQALKENDADFIADFVHVAAEAVVGGEATAPIHKPQAYQKWSVSVDTLALELEDTITADGPSGTGCLFRCQSVCRACNRSFCSKRE